MVKKKSNKITKSDRAIPYTLMTISIVLVFVLILDVLINVVLKDKLDKIIKNKQTTTTAPTRIVEERPQEGASDYEIFKYIFQKVEKDIPGSNLAEYAELYDTRLTHYNSYTKDAHYQVLGQKGKIEYSYRTNEITCTGLCIRKTNYIAKYTYDLTLSRNCTLIDKECIVGDEEPTYAYMTTEGNHTYKVFSPSMPSMTTTLSQNKAFDLFEKE